MFYRLFIYKTRAATGDAPAIRIVNNALKYGEWRSDAENCMCNFDVESVKKELEAATMLNEKTLCDILMYKSKHEDKEYICIRTSYENAKTVLIAAHSAAMRHNLLLFDATMNRSFFLMDFCNETFINMRLRASQLNERIVGLLPVWRLRKLFVSQGKRDNYCAYVLTLQKKKGMTLEESIAQIYEVLKSNLAFGEELTTDNRCFTIKGGTFYEITYCIEAYKKHANKIGYVDNGKVCTSFLGRMGCEEAFKWAKRAGGSLREIKRRMLFAEMMFRYPNPADRFVRSVIITKQLQKELMDVNYGGSGYGGGFVFSVVPYEDEDRHQISRYNMEEWTASYVLVFIQDVYPHIYERYYSIHNHIPAEAIADVVRKMKEFQEMLLKDPFNDELLRYVERFDLWCLEPYETEESSNKKAQRIKENPLLFAYENRYKIVRLLNSFIQWAEAQFEAHASNDFMFDVQGP